MQVLSASVVRQLEFTEDEYNDIQFLCASFVVEKLSGGLNYKRMFNLNEKDIFEETKLKLRDLGYSIEYIKNSKYYPHYYISWGEDDAA